MAGAGTGSVPCWHFTVPLPTFKRRRHPAIHAERLASGRRAHNIDDRVHRAHFVKMHLLDGDGMNRRLRLAQQLKGAAARCFHRIGKRRSANDPENRRQRPMRRVLVGVVLVLRFVGVVLVIESVRMLVLVVVSMAVFVAVAVFVIVGMPFVRFCRGCACFLVPRSLVPSVPRCPAVSTSTLVAANPPRLTLRISRRAPTFKAAAVSASTVEGNARIHQRAQQHVAADPGKALQITNSHRFVIVNCRRPSGESGTTTAASQMAMHHTA